jgi:ribosomal protein S18 acetylase RimI-like enzyme
MNVRAATTDDAAAVAELYSSLEEALLGRPSNVDAHAVLGWWQAISFETNTWLFEEDGFLVAAAGGQVQADRGNADGAVRPSAQGRGLGTRLLELVERRFVEEGAARILSWALAADGRASELFRGRGYREVRRFWEMAIDFEDEPAQPAVAIETFREEDAHAFHAANEEAFEDHWEPHSEAFEEWWPRQRTRTNYDPALWFVIRDGDEVAAIARNELRTGGGYVGSLGVRRPWRGRGYGRALLLHSFREFRRRGMTRATLGVDASNPTGATHLYESVGMHVETEEIVWERLLA